MKNINQLNEEYTKLLIIESDIEKFQNKMKTGTTYRQSKIDDYYSQKYPHLYNGKIQDFWARKRNLQININQQKFKKNG